MALRVISLRCNDLSAFGAKRTLACRLETFVADEVLNCREGRLFEKSEDEDLYALLYQRHAPISSMIMITIDLPG
jgi:hypothetical protein